MPELPEVETTKRGIEPHIVDQCVEDLIIRQAKLRWPIPRNLKKKLVKQKVNSVERRGKYLLVHTDNGTMLMHLGMSGRLQVIDKDQPHEKHDHVDIIMDNGLCLRYTDPRRFGSILWTDSDPYQHKLLVKLGPEPLTRDFSGNYLYQLSRKRKVPVKTFIMNANIVVGVGNIYANEALFLTGIHPNRKADQVSKERYSELVTNIKKVLKQAIKQGGTTLKDFRTTDGKPGYFAQKLQVYGRSGEECGRCENIIEEMRIGQRNTFYCAECQS